MSDDLRTRHKGVDIIGADANLRAAGRLSPGAGGVEYYTLTWTTSSTSSSWMAAIGAVDRCGPDDGAA
jgi:hypothetical protein